MIRILTAIIILPFLTSIAYGQCIVGNSNALQSDPTGLKIGQSFTPTCNGDIEYVEILSPNMVGNNTGGTLKIYNGSTVLSTPIYTQAYPVTQIGAGGAVRIYLLTPVPVVAFQQKTFEMDMSVPVNFAGNNPYPGGRLFYNHTNSSVHAGSDIKFNVSIVSNCTNSSSSIIADACQEYTSPSGLTWTSTGMYMDTIPNTTGCDSVITIDLTVTTIDTTVTVNGLQLTANEANATYQWLDCDNGNAPIAGANQQSYTSTTSGNYAVQLTANNCIEVSACSFVGSTSVETSIAEEISLWPNPAADQINLDLNDHVSQVAITLHDAMGRIILTKKTLSGAFTTLDISDLSPGVYSLAIEDDSQKQVLRFVKE